MDTYEFPQFAQLEVERPLAQVHLDEAEKLALILYKDRAVARAAVVEEAEARATEFGGAAVDAALLPPGSRLQNQAAETVADALISLGIGRSVLRNLQEKLPETEVISYEKVSDLRKEAGVEINDISALLDISASHISRVLRGQRLTGKDKDGAPRNQELLMMIVEAITTLKAPSPEDTTQ